MTRSKQPTPPPPAALPAGEPNRYVATFKASLVKRWSHTRMDALYEQLYLATYLWALGREAEALQILASVTSVVTAPPSLRDGRGNMNVWSPVVTMNALEARLYRLTSDPQAAVPGSRVIADPCLAPNRPYILGKVTGAVGEFQQASGERSVKRACQRLSGRLGFLVLLGELAEGGHRYADWFDAGEVEDRITMGLAMLTARLTAAA